MWSLLINMVCTSCLTSCRTTEGLRNIRKVSKPNRMIAQCPMPPAKAKIPLILAKTPWKTQIKIFPQCPMPRKNQSQPQIFHEWLYTISHDQHLWKKNFQGGRLKPLPHTKRPLPHDSSWPSKLYDCVSLTTSVSASPSINWSMLYHGTLFICFHIRFYILFSHFVVVFHHKICLFIIFILVFLRKYHIFTSED